MFALKEDRKKKFFLALRVTLPVILLIALLTFVVFHEERSIVYDVFVLLLGVFASVYFIFFMIFSELREKILDDTTATFNRKYLNQFLAKNLTPSYYLILISIDNIKEINERYGIENGDRVLRDFARLLDRFFSERFGSIPIGRLQAGDFIFAVRASEKEIKEALEEFMRQYDNTFLNNIELKLFSSYIPVTKEGLSNLKSLYDQLYEDIYYCKGKCKRQTKKNSKKERSKEDLEKQVAQIIEEKRLSLLFQPTLNLHTNRFDMAEIIVKLIDKDSQIIHPSQFVPIVNRLGLENDFDLALTQRLLESIKEKEMVGAYLYSFNLSPYSLRNKRFTYKFFALFDYYGIDPENMVIELFESSIYKDVKYYKKVLDLYKERGFHLAFDNFGSCNASVEYIKSIEVDFIHFDKFFIKNIHNERYRTLLEHWIQAFHKLEIQSVVKFIDKEEILEVVRKMGADYAQGYAIAQPMILEELRRFKGNDNALR